MKNIIKTWLKDHQIELPEERIDILITMLKSELKEYVFTGDYIVFGDVHYGKKDLKEISNVQVADYWEVTEKGIVPKNIKSIEFYE